EGSPERDRVTRLWGYEAKQAGRYAPRSDVFTWKGEPIRVGSPRHHELMRVAVRAKLEQNPRVLRLLLETGQSMITHVLRAKDGRRLPDSKTIPGEVLSRIIISLREEFLRRSGVPSF
ncbi:MAG: hypothetical protein HYV04_06900, partial [Deltaproteobacteria bacterium]|nr:hypothetical protein [Deltaproteobacteria bacterium]